MKIELKDVINFYLGCEVITEKGTIWTLEPSNFLSNWQSSYFLNSKPLLRPLSDLTKEEAIEVTKPVVVYGDIPNARTYDTYESAFGKTVVFWGDGLRERYIPEDETHFCSEQFTYLIKKGFDLFGLIESNQAVDKTKL